MIGEQPLLEVEAGLMRLEIDWRPVEGNVGAFIADRCPGCLREDSRPDGLHMCWSGEHFVLRCCDRGCPQDVVEKGLGMEPLPPTPKPTEGDGNPGDDLRLLPPPNEP